MYIWDRANEYIIVNEIAPSFHEKIKYEVINIGILVVGDSFGLETLHFRYEEWRSFVAFFNWLTTSCCKDSYLSSFSEAKSKVHELSESVSVKENKYESLQQVVDSQFKIAKSPAQPTTNIENSSCTSRDLFSTTSSNFSSYFMFPLQRNFSGSCFFYIHTYVDFPFVRFPDMCLLSIHASHFNYSYFEYYYK